MTDLLGPLVHALEHAKSVIDNHRDYVEKNETRTRNVLVDPVLKALGWDVATVDDIQVEYGAGKMRVDYALLGKDKKPVVLVEAKKLNGDLYANRTQMLTYCTEVGVPHGVLTDGNCWELYDIWQQVPMDDRRSLQLILSSRKPVEAARMLLPLWKPLVQDGGLETNSLAMYNHNTPEETDG